MCFLSLRLNDDPPLLDENNVIALGSRPESTRERDTGVLNRKLHNLIHSCHSHIQSLRLPKRRQLAYSDKHKKPMHTFIKTLKHLHDPFSACRPPCRQIAQNAQPFSTRQTASTQSSQPRRLASPQLTAIAALYSTTIHTLQTKRAPPFAKHDFLFADNQE